MSMFRISKDVFINFVRHVSTPIGRIDQLVSLSEFLSHFCFWWNWKIVPRVSFDFSNGHSVWRLVLEHSIDEIVPFVSVGFFSVSKSINVLFPEMITFSSSHVFVIWIWRFSLMETRSTDHHNVENDSSCEKVNLNSHIFFSFMDFWSHICLSSFLRSVCLWVWPEPKISNF